MHAYIHYIPVVDLYSVVEFLFHYNYFSIITIDLSLTTTLIIARFFITEKSEAKLKKNLKSSRIIII